MSKLNDNSIIELLLISNNNTNLVELLKQNKIGIQIVYECLYNIINDNIGQKYYISNYVDSMWIIIIEYDKNIDNYYKYVSSMTTYDNNGIRKAKSISRTEKFDGKNKTVPLSLGAVIILLFIINCKSPPSYSEESVNGTTILNFLVRLLLPPKSMCQS